MAFSSSAFSNSLPLSGRNHLPAPWGSVLPPETSQHVRHIIESILALQSKPDDNTGHPVQILPPCRQIFRALELTPPASVRAVILGQDPYPTPGNADGLAFSVPPDISPLPPSLRNIFREYSACTGFPVPASGDLSLWAERGVLLLNTILTVPAREPNGHRRLGWQAVTDAILRFCLQMPGPVVFLLWGRAAQNAFDRAAASEGVSLMRKTFPRSAAVSTSVSSLQRESTEKRNYFTDTFECSGNSFILRSSHPSPLGAGKPCGDTPPFLGSRPFSRANELLGGDAVDWRLP